MPWTSWAAADAVSDMAKEPVARAARAAESMSDAVDVLANKTAGVVVAVAENTIDGVGGVLDAATGAVMGAPACVLWPNVPRVSYELVSPVPSSARVRSYLKAWGDDFGPQQLLSYLWPKHGRATAKASLVGALLLLVAAKLFVVRLPLVFKRCIDGLAGGQLLQPAVWLAMYALSRAAYTLMQEARYALFAPVQQHAVRRFMRDAFEHMLLLDAGYISAQSTGELSRVFSRGVRGMNSLLRLLVFNVVPTALEAALVVLLLNNRYGSSFLLISLLTIGTFIGWSIWVIESRVMLLQKLVDADNKLVTKFVNALLNHEAVRSFTSEKHEITRYDDVLGDVEKLTVQDVQIVSVLCAGQALLFSAGLGILLTLCARQVLAGVLTIGDVVAVHALMLQLQQPLTSLGYTYQELRQALTDMKQLLLQLKRSPKVASSPSAPELIVTEGAIRFENVSFGYSQRKVAQGAGTLRGVSFEIPAGKKTAIVGGSGSGKSTALKLISRTYDPQEGKVLIDGQDIREVSLTSLRQHVGLVPQDTILFDDSLQYNLRYGNLDASDETVLAAAKRVGLDTTAGKMPNGYATRVGERGLKLSGGERQRVAIARALLKDPPVMLYDEPTSALDSINEQAVNAVLNEQAQANRTSVVIAHKLRLVQDADLLLVMCNGTLIEQGTHASLLSTPDSHYHQLWEREERREEYRAAGEKIEYGRVALHSDTSGVPGAEVSIQSLRVAQGIDQTLSGGGRGFGGEDDGGWLW